MKLTQELLKLTESRGLSRKFSNLDIFQPDGLESVDVEVKYHYEAASYSDHPYGEGSAREHHPASVELISVKLLSDADIENDQGEVTATLAKGTDLIDQPFWSNEHSDWFIDTLAED